MPLRAGSAKPMLLKNGITPSRGPKYTMCPEHHHLYVYVIQGLQAALNRPVSYTLPHCHGAIKQRRYQCQSVTYTLSAV